MTAERIWTGLDAVTADGLACVFCGRSFRFRRSPVRLPVGRSQTGSQVFACVGDCVDRAAVPRGVTAIPPEALTVAGAAFVAALEQAGGDVHRAWPDDLVTATVRAAVPVVVAAELRRIATQLQARAQELDPAGGESR